MERPVLARRAWLLLFMDAAERNLITPIKISDVHRLVYLANSTAPIFRLPVLEGYLVKNRRGPYFPSLSWDIGRLVGQGLIDPSEIELTKDEIGTWLDGKIQLNTRGMAVCDRICEYPFMKEVSAYLREFMRAYAGLNGESPAMLSDCDIHYDTVSFGLPVITGSDHNLANEAAEALLLDYRVPTSREKLHRYLRYLNYCEIGGEDAA